ncbi:MAG TPA: hypothetical protein VJ822_18760 [Dongiaceae bacterium]|nr:hypothetical protein [Dongiaceae bacterium]
MRAEILELQLDLVADVIDDCLGQPDATGTRDRLQPRRDIDSLAIEIAALDHDVAEIDADPQQESAVVGQSRIGLIHSRLQVHRATHRIDGAGKLRKDAVAHQLDDATVMRGQKRR